VLASWARGHLARVGAVKGSRWLMKTQEKSEGVATVLAVLVGLVGVDGVGHMYGGRIGRGLAILFGDWINNLTLLKQFLQRPAGHQ